MAKYIEREAFAAEMKARQDAAKEWLIEASGIDDADGKIRAETILSFLCEVKLTLDAIPGADVRPVAHGKWVKVNASYYACNSCHRLTEVEKVFGNIIYNFCPFCGADMRDVDKEDAG